MRCCLFATHLNDRCSAVRRVRCGWPRSVRCSLPSPRGIFSRCDCDENIRTKVIIGRSQQQINQNCPARLQTALPIAKPGSRLRSKQRINQNLWEFNRCVLFLDLCRSFALRPVGRRLCPGGAGAHQIRSCLQLARLGLIQGQHCRLDLI